MHQLSMHSPIGDLTLFDDGGKITAIEWGWSEYYPASDLLMETKSQLDAYFDGELISFSTPIKASGSPFQEKVLAALFQVPYGEKRSYMDQSKILGDPKAIREVAKANGDNPIAILIPSSSAASP